jgi:hypothetical protein
MKFYGLMILMAILFQSATSTDATYITGKVVNTLNGKPLTGVQVIASSKTYSDTVITNRFGTFRLDIKPGEYKITFTYFFKIDYEIEKLSVEQGINNLKNVEIEPNTLSEQVINNEIVKSEKDSKLEEMEIKSSSAKIEMKKESRDVDELSGEYPSSKAIGESPLAPASTKGVGESAPSPKSLRVMKKSVRSVVGLSGGVVATSDGYAKNNANAGTLTSGEVNDFRKWEMWNDISADQLKEFKTQWMFNLKERYTVQLVTLDNKPVVDCNARLLNDNGEEVWSGRTDNTGKAELWANIYNEAQIADNKYSIEVTNKDKKYQIQSAKKFQEGVNILRIEDYCDMPDNVDIVFTVDATGSMGDEINYLKAELTDIISKLKEKHKDKKINLGTVFYRDDWDEYTVKKSDLNSDISITSSFIADQQAGGGGDFPEAVDLALMTSINEISWSPKAITRIIFLILDAPPHTNPLVLERLQEITAKAALSGIRIIPVACSGVDKSTEYILRSVALATNGTYVFLTDHSGVGDKHIEPTTDKYDVELMNALFLRLIDQFTIIPECSGEKQFARTGDNNNIFNQDEKHLSESSPDYKEIIESAKCYPNPTSGDLNIEIVRDVDEMYITDIAGKLIIKMEKLSVGKHFINLNDYPTGIYFIKFRINEHWGSNKIIKI